MSRPEGEAIPKSQRKRSAAQESHASGRPTSYKPEFARQAAAMCKLGATNAELADFFQVTTPTIWAWSCQFPAFFNALKLGKIAADEEVVRSLYNRARGYSFDAEEIHVIEGEVVRVPVRKHVPPDTTACIYWTKNRDPGQWRDRREEGGETPGAITIVGGFSGTVTVKAVRGGEVPGPTPESD